MRTFVAAALVATTLALPATNVLAGDLPLPAGKPAGIKSAQDDGHTFLYVVGVGAIIAGIVILASNNGNGHITPGTPPSTSTTT